jgi:amphi-Trp domain-containing protein
MGKKDIEFKVMGTNEQLADYLENIAASLRKNTLYIEQGSQSVTLAPSEEITMELSAKSKEEKEKLSIKLSWRSIPKAVDGDAALKIATEAPAEDPQEAPATEESEIAPVEIKEEEPEEKPKTGGKTKKSTNK